MNTITIILIKLIFLFLFVCFITALYYYYNKNKIVEMMVPHFSDSFCKKYNKTKGELEKQCSNLTKSNCKEIGCCNWLNGTKCVAGNEHGPVYKVIDGLRYDIDTFYFKNKCYGKGCSNIQK